MSMESATNRGRETTPIPLDATSGPSPHVRHTRRQCRWRHREGVIIARLQLSLNLHVAGDRGPDERVDSLSVYSRVHTVASPIER
jgi:hypothetical protein